MMNRRSLLKALGLAPAVPALASFAAEINAAPVSAETAVPLPNNAMNLKVWQIGKNRFEATWDKFAGQHGFEHNEVRCYEIIAIRPPEMRYRRDGSARLHIDYEREEWLCTSRRAATVQFTFSGGYQVIKPEYFAVRARDFCGNCSLLSVAKFEA